MRLAGDVADGVLLNWCTPERVGSAKSELREGAETAYARQFALRGLEEESRQAATAHASGRPEDIPEELVRAVTLAGDPLAARGRLDAFREAGADLPVVYPVATPGAVARTLIAAVPV